MNTVISGAELAPFVHGILSLEAGTHGLVLHRLPAWARAQVEDRLLSYAEACPTGGVLRFATTAPEITLTLATTVAAAPGADPRLAELVVLGPAGRTSVVVPSPTVLEVSATGVAVRPAGAVEVTIPAGGTVEVHLPHAAHVELVAISATADVVPVAAEGVRWTHYGSSISQGMNAVDPTRTWPVQAALSLGWSLTDLAFAGNAQLDQFAARLIRDTPADLITLKVGINLLNADSMRERTFRPALHGFLDTIREGQPETRIVVITALACPIHEHTPGPVVDGEGGMMRAAARSVEPDTGALTLSRTREIIAEVVAARNDANLALVDGLSLFGLDDAHLLYDDLHPDQAGLDLIAERFVGMAPSLV